MGDKMLKISENNVFQYLKWRGDLSFEQDKFNEVDAFILTQLIYYDYNDIVKNEKVLLKNALKLYYEINNNRKIKPPTEYSVGGFLCFVILFHNYFHCCKRCTLLPLIS